jgi:hypothetical protein
VKLLARRASRLRWWREVLYVGAFYGVYSLIRNHGLATDSVDRAFAHAKEIIRLEQLVGLYHEETIQDWFLGARWFIRFWNIYYGTAHFVVTAAALIWLFRRMPERYPLWRNALACTTGLALIGFALYPLMPPRLLNVCGPYGACATHDYGFVDTLRQIGGLWSFDSGTIQKLSNQFAAMPSLHVGWATWSTLVLWPACRRGWQRALAVAHPVATVFCIVVTGNHYLLDAVGGWATLGAGIALAGVLTRYTWVTDETLATRTVSSRPL